MCRGGSSKPKAQSSSEAPSASSPAWHPRTAPVAQVSKPAVSPISQSAGGEGVGWLGLFRSAAGGRTISGFGNPRYCRLGSLRYAGAVRGCAGSPARHPRTAPVAQVSKPAVSPISKSAGGEGVGWLGLFRSTAGGRTISGFGNPQYSRLGSLRYAGAVRGCARSPARHPLAPWNFP